MATIGLTNSRTAKRSDKLNTIKLCIVNPKSLNDPIVEKRAAVPGQLPRYQFHMVYVKWNDQSDPTGEPASKFKEMFKNSTIQWEERLYQAAINQYVRYHDKAY